MTSTEVDYELVDMSMASTEVDACVMYCGAAAEWLAMGVACDLEPVVGGVDPLG